MSRLRLSTLLQGGRPGKLLIPLRRGDLRVLETELLVRDYGVVALLIANQPSLLVVRPAVAERHRDMARPQDGLVAEHTPRGDIVGKVKIRGWIGRWLLDSRYCLGLRICHFSS